MASRIVVTSRASKRFELVSKTRKIPVKAVAEALGGKVVSTTKRRNTSPVGLIALREQVSRLLKSTGGRPALENSEGRQKIPLQKGDWERLQKLAEEIAGDEKKPTPAQIASLLLHRAIDEAERGLNQ